MKKIIAIMLALILTVSVLASCTKQPAEPDVTDDQTAITDVDTPDTDSTDGEADEQKDITPADPDEAADPAETDEASEDEKFEIANTLIDHPVSDLYEAIGEPLESAYASSCMGGGQDGELYYREFTVVTYLENGSETVVDVYSTK